MSSNSMSVAELLRLAQASQADATDQLFSLLYEELRRLARQVRTGRGGPLDTTELVHEAYLKLAPEADYENRLHFFRTAASAMRQVLVSAARKRVAEKRGGGALMITFSDGEHPIEMQAEKFIELDEALEEFRRLDPRAAQVVECRFFSGLTNEETAAALGVSPRTTKRDWRVARAFLRNALTASPA